MSSFERQLTELRQRVSDVSSVASSRRSAKRQRLIEQRLCAVEQAQLAIDAPEQRHHLGLDVGLRRKIRLDAVRTSIEQLPRGDLRRVRERRVGNFEEAHEEAAHLTRLRGFT